MNLYGLEVFLHITGVVVVFGGYGALIFASIAMRFARTTEELRAVARLSGGRRIGFEYISAIDAVVVAGAVLLVVTGAIMANSVWGFGRPWIEVSIVSVVAIGLTGAFVLGPRLHRVDIAAREAPDGPLPEALIGLTHDVVSGAILYAAAGGLLGVVFVMTNKPALLVSAIAVALPCALGVVIGLVGWPRGHTGRVPR